MLLEGLETLEVLSREGTMGKTASKLFITQSAVSKRIAALESRIGQKLIEPEGRHIRLTPRALRLLQEAKPSLANLKGLLFEEMSDTDTALLSIAAAEPLLAGPMAPFMREYLQQDPYWQLHAHRTPTIIERVKSGDIALGLCTGHLGNQQGLSVETLAHEPMVLVSQTPPPAHWPDGQALPCMSIDLQVPSNRYLAEQLREANLQPVMQMNSQFTLARLAAQGGLPAVAPRSVATMLNTPAHCIYPLASVTRPVVLLYRPGVVKRSRIKRLLEAIRSYFLTCDFTC